MSTATADGWAGQFPVEQMRKHGITVKLSKRTKSVIYKEVLPLINSCVVRLLDLPRLRAQLGGLERRVARGGRDSIDHPPGGHDNVINAVAGALVAVAERRPRWGVAGGDDDEQQQAGSLAEEELIPCGPQVIGVL